MLKRTGILDAWGDEAAMDRGAKVHRMVHAWFDNDLAAVPDWLEPYLEGIKNFVAQTGFKPKEWETPVHDPVFRYAGTPDMKGRFPGDRLDSIGDIKTGSIGRWTRVQTAAYSLGKPYKRFALGLGEGLCGGRNYQFEPYGIDTLIRDLRVFQTSLAFLRASAFLTKESW